MKKIIKNTILIITSLFIITSCSKKGVSIQTNGIASPVVNSKIRTANYRSQSVAMDSLNSKEYAYAEEMESSTVERKLIKTGNITLEVESLSESEKLIENFAKTFGGYITNSSTYDTSFNATVKIPCNYFDDAMTAAGELGKLKYRSVNNQDVTDEFYDLETRLNTKKIMQKKLEGYLAQAKDIKDLLEVERQLNNVTSEIEVMEGRMKRLTNQIDYSTIEIYMNLPVGFNEDGFKWPDLGEKFRNFGSNFVNFLANILMGFFYLIVFGIPVLAIISFLFWLLFGRVGLLRKLFSKLKKK